MLLDVKKLGRGRVAEGCYSLQYLEVYNSVESFGGCEG
jgi:hypothetical protein